MTLEQLAITLSRKPEGLDGAAQSEGGLGPG